jgi:glyoxylase-like metal-dependent hydrolase (beta-lactamase superfamily II)
MLELSATLVGVGPSVIHPTLMWDKETVILVDAGLPGLLPQLREAMEKAGVPFDSLNNIIITHHDMDHIGSLSSILDGSSHKIHVLAHDAEKPYIQAEQPPLRMLQMEAQLSTLPEERREQMRTLYESLKASYKNFGVHVDRTVADGEELPYLGGITVIHTPGHTPGHIYLYLQQTKTLVAGDAMNVENGKLVPAPRFTLYDQDAAARSLKKLARYDIQTVICYHGGLYDKNPSQRIAELASA